MNLDALTPDTLSLDAPDAQLDAQLDTHLGHIALKQAQRYERLLDAPEPDAKQLAIECRLLVSLVRVLRRPRPRAEQTEHASAPLAALTALSPLNSPAEVAEAATPPTGAAPALSRPERRALERALEKARHKHRARQAA